MDKANGKKNNSLYLYFQSLFYIKLVKIQLFIIRIKNLDGWKYEFQNSKFLS